MNVVECSEKLKDGVGWVVIVLILGSLAATWVMSLASLVSTAIKAVKAKAKKPAKKNTSVSKKQEDKKSVAASMD